ncbi:WXG100 family type VII secretion target [Actinoplanes hulinensis]|uniref:WXG100 family type VII secretion target n=1 Tax=Actinoplanes hulinensis TaxID=1144547 RepID=A0ABS7BGJ9_9ACTN|nr:WXG100 family type VII secretion target [Actinoplanes hulinensis]MBW6440018.1 WXG100 family type VII secretion target [Actinoplanes hulinensis]
MSVSSTEAVLLERIHSTIDRIDAKTVELQNSINDKLAYVPPPAQGKIRQGWDDFCAFMRRIWDNLATILSNMGSLSALSTTAQAWSDRVGVPVSGQVQAADAGLLTVDDNWAGDAADAYRQMLPLQKAALEKVKTVLTDGLSTALEQVRTGVFLFWTGLLGALAALAVGIIGALASSATIFGLPAAPFIAAGAAVTASIALIVGCETLKSACTSANSLLRQKFDDTGFFQGHWPPAGTA